MDDNIGVKIDGVLYVRLDDVWPMRDEIERLRAALREKDNIAYVIDGHGVTHNTFTIVYKGGSDD